MTGFVDREIGRILETLNSENLRNETVVIFLSDHGDLMGGHWQTGKGVYHFDDVIRVPFIWSWSGHFPEGMRTDGVVSTVDILPAVLDICDVPFPEPGYEGYVEPGCGLPALPGRSIREQLEGTQTRTHDGVIVESDDYYGLRARTYVTDRYKLTMYPDEEYGELFDLGEDPEELHNRWGDQEYADVRAQLSEEFLDAYIQQDSCLPRKPASWA